MHEENVHNLQPNIKNIEKELHVRSNEWKLSKKLRGQLDLA